MSKTSMLDAEASALRSASGVDTKGMSACRSDSPGTDGSQPVLAEGATPKAAAVEKVDPRATHCKSFPW